MAFYVRFVSGGRKHRVESALRGLAVKVTGVQCPLDGCAERSGHGLIVRGYHRSVLDDGQGYAADAHCVACGGHVGTLIAKVGTIFGVEEDERVMETAERLGIRVY